MPDFASKALRTHHKPCRIIAKSIGCPMPSLPAELGQWFAPSAFLAVAGLILGLQGKRIDEQGKRIDELRADLKASEARQQQDMKELRADLKASEARQQQDMRELRTEVKEGFAQCRAEQREDSRALNEKLDRLVEALLTVKQP
ncbi:hypothetical protein BV53_03645 [Candidatus Synechococcus spongiarum LMB bulk15N]|uniref:Uncharacterized protein n=2 Tax=Candidatus Synechococcus spongiarum TaxID=431041 RepID=A0A1T1D3W7_9SYNE|nr:hypothetical protein BV53_03645 [Candidatus Synechococcus spongiarum LMB bulk15N]